MIQIVHSILPLTLAIVLLLPRLCGLLLVVGEPSITFYGTLSYILFVELFHNLKEICDYFCLEVFELDLENFLGMIQSRLDLFLFDLHVAEVSLGGLRNILVLSLTLKLGVGDNHSVEILSG